MNEVTTIGLALASSVQVHGVDASGVVTFRRRASEEVLAVFAKLRLGLVGIRRARRRLWGREISQARP